MQTEMDSSDRELNAQPVHYGSGSTSGSLTFIHHLDVGRTTLLDSLYTKVNAEPKTF